MLQLRRRPLQGSARRGDTDVRNRFAARRFAAFVRTRRGEHSLREAAAEIGTVSPATLLRIEREEVPDIETFLRVCDWLEIAPREFLEADEVEERMNMLEGL